MKSACWLPLSALALLGLLSAPARAQWVPGGTLIASHVFDFDDVVAVPDGQAGALVLGLELGSIGGHAVERVGPDGRFPPGWPSTALEPMFLSSGLAADGTGGAYVGRVKQGPTNSQIVVDHVLAGGLLDPAWPASGRVIADVPSALQGCQLAPDGSGGVYVAFCTGTDQGNVLAVLRLDATGAASPGWPAAGVQIMQSGEFIYFGNAQGTPAGLFVVGDLSPTIPNDQPHDAFIGHVSPSGAIPAGWGTGTIVLPYLLPGSNPPRYTPDTAGGLYYAWGNGRVGRLVHLLADAAVDPAWPVQGLALLPDTTHFQFLYNPVSDGAGGFFARFDYDSAGTNVSLVPRLVHITANATPEPGWPLLGGRLPYVGNGFNYGDIVPDGNGGAYATWFEEQVPAAANGFRYLRAHHLAAGGVTAPYWPATGLTLANGPGVRLASRTVTDGHGGAIALWVGTLSDTADPSDNVLLGLGFGPDGSLTTSVDGRDAEMAVGLRASPVPSRAATSLAFSLPHTAEVRLDVLDLSGRRIRHLLEGTFAPGPHSVSWDGRDDAGRSVPPGVYLAHAEGGVVSSARLVRVR